MNAYQFTALVLALSYLVSCQENKPQPKLEINHLNEKTELTAWGAYPDYNYNLANELNNAGRVEKAQEAYQNCIASSKSQTVVEDAMYNLSQLYFETEQPNKAYDLMDSLLARKYTWLGWYKNANHTFSTTLDYMSRLDEIDKINALKNSPQNCQFHYEDVSNFITAFEKSKTDWANAPSYFYHEYFAKASKGLYFYQKFKIQSSSHQFAYRVEDKHQYFESILPNLRKLNTQEEKIRGYLEKFENLYPEAVFPDIYFTVGCFNAGGTSSPFGLLIGSEMHTKTEESNLSNFNNWEKKVVRSFSNLPLITLHELVHIQQQDNYDNLLGNAIYEGAADFISELICGSHINQYVHNWANQHEAEVWKDFKEEMKGNNVHNWIGNANQAENKPADLGYYVGYKICESYYAQKKNKEKAVHDILTITDWEDFYLKSGYMQERN